MLKREFKRIVSATSHFFRRLIGIETLDFTFVEEPLGIPANQGYGYLQIDFGERIGPNGRYEIARKLGWGGNASVWLARDHELDRYVAIKALTGSATSLHERGIMQELPIMQAITKLVKIPSQSAYCATLHAHFTHKGKPNDGDHLCLVMDVSAGDFVSLHRESRRLPIPLAKLVLRDTLRGLRQLHALGIAHTDLKASNIMCHYPDIVSDNNIRTMLQYDPSRRHPAEPSLNYSVQAAVSQPLTLLSTDQALSASYALSDFGSAQFVNNQITSFITPDVFRAPETILQGPWGCQVDIWTLGCLAYELICGVPLFSREHRSMEPDLYHIAQIIKFTGEEFPPELIQSYKAAPQYLDMTTGHLAISGKPMATIHFSQLFRRNAEILGLAEHDVSGVIDLLARCLRVNPADRSTAETLLHDNAWLLELGDDV